MLRLAVYLALAAGTAFGVVDLLATLHERTPLEIDPSRPPAMVWHQRRYVAFDGTAIRGEAKEFPGPQAGTHPLVPVRGVNGAVAIVTEETSLAAVEKPHGATARFTGWIGPVWSQAGAPFGARLLLTPGGPPSPWMPFAFIAVYGGSLMYGLWREARGAARVRGASAAEVTGREAERIASVSPGLAFQLGTIIWFTVALAGFNQWLRPIVPQGVLITLLASVFALVGVMRLGTYGAYHPGGFRIGRLVPRTELALRWTDVTAMRVINMGDRGVRCGLDLILAEGPPRRLELVGPRMVAFATELERRFTRTAAFRPSAPAGRG